MFNLGDIVEVLKYPEDVLEEPIKEENRFGIISNSRLNYGNKTIVMVTNFDGKNLWWWNQNTDRLKLIYRPNESKLLSITLPLIVSSDGFLVKYDEQTYGVIPANTIDWSKVSGL